MDDDGGFLRWFVPWKGTRPEMTLIGWYVLADLEAAFNAGVAMGLDIAATELTALLNDPPKKD